MKTALIFDLDITNYPTRSVADDMYKDLFALLKSQLSIKSIREDILTTPFQKCSRPLRFV